MSGGLGFRRKLFAMSRSELRGVIEKGRRLPGRCMVLCVARAGAGRRFGVSASRRVGGAVERNRAKRLLREVMRLNGDRAVEGARVVAIARAGVLHNAFEAKELEFLTLLGNAGLLKSNRPARGMREPAARK